MGRLTLYLLRVFTSEAMALFAVALFLLFLIQCLALFGLVAEQGQGLLILMGQATLGMSTLAIVFLYVCLGIGLARGLRGLQDRAELQVIHVNSLTGALMRAILVYALGGAVVLLALAHIVEPQSARSKSDLAASIAADLVSRSMIPHRFTEVMDGVSFLIGSRDSEGRITDFFADDTRAPEMRRTYFAQSALIARDEQGYVLRMFDGAIQQFGADKRISQIAFTRYDLALDQLTGSVEVSNGLAATPTPEIVRDALAAGSWSPAQIDAVAKRSVEGLRVIAICLFVASLATFPTGNRRRRFAVPVELTVLAVTFIERGVSSYAPLPEPLNMAAGPVLLGSIAFLSLTIRFRFFLPPGVPRPA